MRRSLAPSQLHIKKNQVKVEHSNGSKAKEKDDSEVTICRLPLFGFLEIPEVLNKQFKIPSGCVLTEQSIALRKIKSLGPQRAVNILRPGQMGAFVKPLPYDNSPVGSEENEEEGLPTANLPPFEPLVLWRDPDDETNKIEVIPDLACKLRPHQREGVQFLFECTMGLRGFEGQGCILADDMGLGKTLMSITLLWTLLNQGMSRGASAVTKIMIVCPTSLVGNWDNEIRKWVGERCPTFAVKAEPKKMIRNFVAHRGKAVLIVSYETQRLYSKLFENNTPAKFQASGGGSVCDLLICDEAHKLKNADSGLAKSLSLLPAKKRVLLSGTPMQNELTEFYNMVNFCNPLVLGTISEFKKRYERPILASREPDASDSEVAQATRLQKELSTLVNEFILKRGNILNAQHLPPKLVQFVCCRLTPLQEALYECLLSSKEVRHVREGKQTNTLNSIRQLINMCSHPKMLLDGYHAKILAKESVDADLQALVDIIHKHTAANPTVKPVASAAVGSKSGLSSSFGLNRLSLSTRGGFGTSASNSNSSSSSSGAYCDPEQSGKMSVLYRMIQTMRALKTGERIVVVSNYTQTLDLIEAMCEQNSWHVLRLDGSVNAAKRTKLVDDFNNPGSSAFVFLLSSKAGGCGINLIGGSRLVLFDPDWNPASDKQAAARIWREGQKRRCFIYRFMSTGSIEEKIIQRQLSKEGLADIVDDKEQVNCFSSDELRALFELRKDTASDTHDTLRCKRCASVKALDFKRDRRKALNAAQTQACAQFLTDFCKHLETEASMQRKRETRRITETGGTLPACFATDTEVTLPFAAAVEELRSQLLSGEFATLPQFSKQQREILLAIDAAHCEAKKSPVATSTSTALTAAPAVTEGGDVGTADALIAAEEEAERALTETYRHLFASSMSIQAEYIRMWSDAAPAITLLTDSNTSGNKGAAAEGEEQQEGRSEEGFVEQEGCPEDTDLNSWSHHCGVASCDDELLGRALADDPALVSFVFGLEVNWSLLRAREEATREESEARKEQCRLDLEQLNAERRRKRRREQGIEEEDEQPVDAAVNALNEGEGVSVPPKKKGKKQSKEGSDKRDAGGKAKKSKKSAKTSELLESAASDEDVLASPSASLAKHQTREAAELSLLAGDDIVWSDSDGEEGGGDAVADVRWLTVQTAAVAPSSSKRRPTTVFSDDEDEEEHEEVRRGDRHISSSPPPVAARAMASSTNSSHGAATDGNAIAAFFGAAAAQSSGNGSKGTNARKRKGVIDDEEEEEEVNEDNGCDTATYARRNSSSPTARSSSKPSALKSSATSSAAKATASRPKARVVLSDDEQEQEEPMPAVRAAKRVLVDITNTQPERLAATNFSSSSSAGAGTSKKQRRAPPNEVVELLFSPGDGDGDEELSPGSAWDCDTCTFSNSSDTNPLVCEICGTKRVRVPRESAAASRRRVVT